MSNEVYANGREISCKSGSGKTICAFPDVCFTPPENPATPPGVPIPYPNTGMDSDATEGSKTVKISDKEVMLKNKSYFKSSSGDEAGAAAKKGVVTSVNRGKVYFNAWSSDVKFEGENVVRHLDITTHNHASFPGNSPTWPFLDAQAFAGSGPCKELAKKVNDSCVETKKKPKGLVAFTIGGEVKRKESMDAMCANKDCKEAMECVVSPYSPNNCCDKTPHHIVPDSQFKAPDSQSKAKRKRGRTTWISLPQPPANPGYSHGSAPCICAEGVSHSTGLHGEIHTETTNQTLKAMAEKSRANVSKTGKSIDGDLRWKVSEAEEIGAKAVAKKMKKCDADCIQAQVRKGNEAMGINENDEIRPQTCGKVTEPVPQKKRKLR